MTGPTRWGRKTRLGVGLAAVALSIAANGQPTPQPDPILTLPQAVSLASGAPPSVAALESDARAGQQSAIAARSLPDPQLTAGIENFPATGRNGLRPAIDEMTMYTFGVIREQVRRSSREAEAQRILADALVSERKASAEELHIRREAMVAWIDAVEAREKQKLLERLIGDLRTGRKVMEAAIPTSGSTPALVLQTDAEIGVGESQLERAKSDERRARAELARWIGPDAASRPLPDTLPKIEPPQDNHGSHGHPELLVAEAEQQVAERQVDVARQARKPDFSWSVSVGIRPNYGQMVSAGISIPLQLNRRAKQDRMVSDASERANAARLRVEDKQRELTAEYATAFADFQGAEAELSRITTGAIPQLEAAFNAAQARYAGGGGTLDQPFAIVRRYIEMNLQALEIRGRRARAVAELIHANGEGTR